MTALYLCPCCSESVEVDVLGRMASHPSRITPGYDCPASGHRPKVMERFEKEDVR